MSTYTQHRFHVLDGMRGIAAIAVMFYHYNLAMDHEFHSKFTSNTYISVDFFFVLSGFVVSYAYAHKILGGMTTAEYMARRIARLFPLAALGLLVGLPAFYALSVVDTHEYSWGQAVTAFFCNLFFLPYIPLSRPSVKIFPMDSALWSVFFEMVASIVFVWLVRVRSQRLFWLCLASYLLFFFASFMHDAHLQLHTPDANLGWSSHNIMGGFPRVFSSFIMGMLIYRLFKDPPQSGMIGALCRRQATNVYVIYIALAAMLFFPFYAKGAYLFLAILLISPLLVLQGSKAKCESHFVTGLSEFLGWISYPLYCLHIPVLDGVRALDKYYGLSANLPLKIIAVPAAIVLAMASAKALDLLHVQKRLGNGLTKMLGS